MNLGNLENLKNEENILEDNQNILKKLKEKFWENVKNWIKENISETKIDFLQKLNEKFWEKFISSCFHPDEFGIWAYRTTSLINISQLSKELDLKPEILYLDSINWGWIKWFPNNMIWKPKKTIINSILDFSKEEQNIAEKIKQRDQIFDSLLNSTWFQADVNAQVLKYIESIFEEIWIFEDLENFIKENDFSDRDAKLFKTYILKEKIIEVLSEIKNIFWKKILDKKYKDWISQVEIYAELQNAILTIVCRDFLWKYKENIDFLDIKNKTWINLEINYNKKENLEDYISSIKIILEDKNFSEDLFLEYFENLLLKSDWRPVEIFSYLENSKNKKIVVWKDEAWEIKFFSKISKDFEPLDKKEFFELIVDENKKLNFSWSIILFLSCLSWGFHIWSERWIREIVAKTFSDFLEKKWLQNEKTKNYVENVILWLWIFDTFEENWDNSWKNLAWSCGSFPDDMLKLSFIWWNFAKDQLEKAILSNNKKPEIDEKILLESLENCVKNTYFKLKTLADSKNKENFLIDFYNLDEKYKKEKNLENFLNLAKLCFSLEKYL